MIRFTADTSDVRKSLEDLRKQAGEISKASTVTTTNASRSPNPPSSGSAPPAASNDLETIRENIIFLKSAISRISDNTGKIVSVLGADKTSKPEPEVPEDVGGGADGGEGTNNGRSKFEKVISEVSRLAKITSDIKSDIDLAKKAITAAIGKLKLTKDASDDDGEKSEKDDSAKKKTDIPPVTDGYNDTDKDAEKASLSGKASKLAGVPSLITSIGVTGSLVQMIAQSVIDGLKKAFEAVRKLASVYDPIGADAIMSKMNASISKMKSALGKAVMPLFEDMADKVSEISDNITRDVEYVYTAIGFVQGFFGMTAEASEDAKDAIEEASEAADEGLASFDKLNTLGDVDVSGLEEAERIKQLQAEAYKNGKKAAKQLEETFLFGIPSALDSLGRRWSEDVADLGAQLDRLWTDFRSWGVSAWDGISEAASSVWNGVVSGASGIWDSISATFADISSRIGTVLSGGWKGLVDGAKDVWSEMSDSIGSIASKIRTFIENAVRDAFKNAGLGWVVDVADTVTEISDTVKGSVEKSFQMAESGDIGGAVSNLALTSTTGDALEKIADIISSTFSQKVDVTLDIDGRTLARETIDFFQSEANRIGGGVASFFGI